MLKTTTPVTLEEMLEAREKRVMHTNELIEKHNLPVVCVTMNLVGDKKVLPLSRRTFSDYCKKIEANAPVYSEIQYNRTGDTGYFVFDCNEKELKESMCSIEDSEPVGRLFDIDVIGTDKNKLSRKTLRRCIICDKPAAECSRSRAHGVETVRARSQELLIDYIAGSIDNAAYNALIAEVEATPKPGLVDMESNGAHDDMTPDTFYASAESLKGYFKAIAVKTMTTPSDEKSLMSELKRLGVDAEKKMLLVTGGVNTHKGAIYLLGLLSAGVAYALYNDGGLRLAIEFAKSLANYSTDAEKQSRSDMLYKKYGAKGARGEAQGGFEGVLFAMDRLNFYINDKGLDKLSASALCVSDLMLKIEDSNVLYRSGKEGLEYMKERMSESIEIETCKERLAFLSKLDSEFTERRISAGGCADILACALFLREIKLL